MAQRIAYQGEPGAYSHQACEQTFPEYAALSCPTFEDAVEAVNSGRARLAMLPVENSVYGRVADIHRLIPESGLFIIDEVFLRIRINLLVVPGTEVSQVTTASSHAVLLGQCRKFFRQHGIRPAACADTAGAARSVAEQRNPSIAALASDLAGRIHGLEVALPDIEDEVHNRTRFLVMSRRLMNQRRSEHMMTSFVFAVRNIPAALFKALGGFATNNVNMVKLESYMVGGSFSATQFFAEIEGHPDDGGVRLAMEELQFFTDYLKIIGIYPAASERYGEAAPGNDTVDR
ncbi:MAG: prephenate dehydratase [Rhodobacteraceae bacterium]|nr:prephenate dehydratase [Paracoccaceae bacterium]